MNLKNKKVTVMGIGLHGGGVAMIEWLVKEGARVFATDKKSKKELQKSLEQIDKLKNVKIIIGQHRMEDFTNVDLVIKNPAVSWKNKYIKAALENKVPVEMDSSMFMKFCPTKNIIGVTGTKGKTTTSLLIAHILSEAGKNVVKVGIGQEAVIDKLAKIKKDSWVVFELSSWRLSAFEQIKKSPHISVITNIFQDHLNYYSSMKDYVSDKENIFKFQKKGDFLIINHDQEEYFEEFEEKAKSKVVSFSKNNVKTTCGLFVEDEKIKYECGEEKIDLFDIKNIVIRGKHNISNVITASAVALLIGVSPRDIKKAVATFSGVKHRLEYIGKKKGVAYYNDTTATTPEAAIVGIEAFSRPIHLICGGSNKNLDLRPLVRKIATDENVISVSLLKGDATERLIKLLREFNGAPEKIVGLYDEIKGAVCNLYVTAKEGEIVLLSPGCASFGMFANEFDRGERFKEAVKMIEE